MTYTLSTRARNALLREGIELSLKAVSRTTEEQLRAIPGCGRSTVKEIRAWLQSVGMDVHDPYLCPAGGDRHKLGEPCYACGGFTTWGSDWRSKTTVYPIAGSRLPAYGTDKEVREDGGFEGARRATVKRKRRPNPQTIARFTKYLNRHGYTVIPPKR